MVHKSFSIWFSIEKWHLKADNKEMAEPLPKKFNGELLVLLAILSLFLDENLGRWTSVVDNRRGP